jgi:hypothetical protein
MKTKLHGKFQWIPTFQVVNFEEHIEPPSNLASSFPSSLDFPINVKPTSTKWKLDFDVHKPNPKLTNS